jgi:hypothetical protein
MKVSLRLPHTAVVSASVLAVCLAVLVFAAPALAGRPTGGAHYFGIPGGATSADGFHKPIGELRVARSGRSVAPTKLTFSCGSGGREVRVRLFGASGRRSAVSIGRDGRFTAVGRGGVVLFPVRPGRPGRVGRYRLRGRFLTRGAARVAYTERRLRSRRLVCRSDMRLYRNGVPPFSGCRSQPATTVLWGDTGRVFWQFALRRNNFGELYTHAYVCLFDSPSKRVDLGEDYAPDDYREKFRLAGSFVAFFRTECPMCMWPQRWIEVRDARDGSLVSEPDVQFWTRLTDLALKRSGSVAWTLERLALGPDGYPIGYQTPAPLVIETREVWAVDSHGQRLLDSGPDVVTNSLELNESTLTWTNGSNTRSATLD